MHSYMHGGSQHAQHTCMHIDLSHACIASIHATHINQSAALRKEVSAATGAPPTDPSQTDLMMETLQSKASSWSGVSHEEAFSIDEVDLYTKLGHGTFVKLSTAFYNRVYADSEDETFRSIFANSNKEDAIQNQYEFFIQRMGGPPLYSQRKGHPALIGRHGPYSITKEGARRWLEHMQAALDSVEEIDADSKRRMFNFFRHTAFFLVAGKEMMMASRNQA